MDKHDETLRDVLTSELSDNVDEPSNIVDVVYGLGKNIVYAAKLLGTNDVAEHMGAIELLAFETKNAGKEIAESIKYLADTLKEISNRKQ